MRRRTERINELLREEISELLRRRLKDPRLSLLLTITEVETSADLKHAKVFVSVMGSETEKRATLRSLGRASGFIRRELAPRLNLRHIPELSFYGDDSLERGAHLLELIKRVAEEDSSSSNV